MERLISKEVIYLDYNATSPLSQSVVNLMSKGDFDYKNPSSQHSSGKQADRQIRDTRDFLYQTFHLTSEQHRLFFHSGATEGINTLLKGFANDCHLNGKEMHFFFAATDHAAVCNVADQLHQLGHHVYPFAVDKNGNFNQDKLVEQILQVGPGPVLLNYTHVNNETGVVWDLKRAEQIKEKTGCFVHVDAAQLVGKIDNWWQLSKRLDAYTFSGHKFGAMKGIGFSFVAHHFSFSPLLVGGGQQQGMRSGTGNVLGIKSCQLALSDMLDAFDGDAMLSVRSYLEASLLDLFKERAEIVARCAKDRAFNTVYLLIKGQKSDSVVAALDLAGIEVSSGSACAAGVIKASRVLLAMGYHESLAKEGIRLSFCPGTTVSQMKEYCQRLGDVLRRFV